MISRVLDFSVHQRWLVVLLSLLAAALGVYSLSRLPIDARTERRVAQPGVVQVPLDLHEEDVLAEQLLRGARLDRRHVHAAARELLQQ